MAQMNAINKAGAVDEGQARITEYQALRGEITALINRRTQRLTVAWGGVAALIAAGAVGKMPELSCLALLLVASAWRDELNQLNGIIKIGSYIECFIEKQTPGLAWESAIYSLESVTPLSTRERLSRTLLSNYGVFAVVCALAAVVLFLACPPSTPIRWTLSAIIVLFALFFIFMSVRQGYNISTRSTYWRVRFLGLAEDAAWTRGRESPTEASNANSETTPSEASKAVQG
jgi:hypothetical protein